MAQRPSLTDDAAAARRHNVSPSSPSPSSSSGSSRAVRPSRAPIPVPPTTTPVTLPTALLFDVFWFLAVSSDDALLPDGLDAVRYRHQLFTIQQVCRAWHAHALLLSAQYATRALRIEAWWLVEKELSFSMRTIARRGAQARQLELIYGRLRTAPTRGPSHSACFDCRLAPGFADLENRIFDWRGVFSTCAALRRLDLSLTPFDPERLERVLEAASTHAPRLEALVLPTICRDFPARTMDETNLLPVLATVLPRWKASNGGLRQLSLSWYRFQSAERKQTLLEIVRQNCPRIQYLRDWTPHPLLGGEDPRDADGGDLFTTDLLTWRNVTASLVHLRELFWRVPPESRPYAEVFAATRKPWLKDLYLNYTTNTPFAQPDHEGLAPQLVDEFFSALPALQTFSLVTERYHDLHLDLVTPHDAYLAAMQAHCQYLESIRIQICVGKEHRQKLPMVTDAGLETLARMPSLRHLDLFPVHISPRGLLALLRACWSGVLHDIEISLYPVEREFELMQRALQFVIDKSLSTRDRAPRFALHIHQTTSTKYRQHTRNAIEELLERVRDGCGHAGHAVHASVDKPYENHCCEFSLRVNRVPKDELRSRQLWKKPIDCEGDDDDDDDA